MRQDDRPSCTCTAFVQPCAACRAWGDERRLPVRRDTRLPQAELRLRGITHHYAPEATMPLFVPLATLEVAWL